MKKKISILTMLAGLGVLTFIGLSNNWLFSPNSTSAQQVPEFNFDEINEIVKQNIISPDISLSTNIADGLFDNLSVVEIPKSIQDSISADVATAYLNGTSTIDENNIVATINDLAGQSLAPSYADTNIEQVKVIREYLNRLLPDLVKSSGNMNDLEAYAVFVATFSQKMNNESFMVSETEFSTNLNNPVSQPFPGSTEFEVREANIVENTAEMNEMETVLDNYAGSKNLASTSYVLSSIGIN